LLKVLIAPQVAELLQSERLAQESEARLRTIADNVPALISYVDTNERYRFVNRAYLDWFDLRLVEIIGRTMREVWGYEAYAIRKPHVEAVLRGERVSFDRHMMRNGREFYLEIVFIPQFDHMKQVVGFFVLSLDISDRKQKEALLESMALHDPLTGLANRRLLADRISMAIVQARRGTGAMAVLFFDLDGFKQVNDTMGHECGDMLLKMVGERLAMAVRQGDTVARLGGDEFVIALSQVGCARDAVSVAENALAAVSCPFELAGRPVALTTSVGVSLYPTHGRDAESLIKTADHALYRAKSAGKNVCHIADLDQESQTPLELAGTVN
jgi:diguanylate cyclase (GGDEF)-like protein/PAS domain S-box-containing protein